MPSRKRKLSAAAIAVAIGAAAIAPANSQAEELARADDGARVISETWLDDRMVDLEIETPALDHTAMVRLLVPQGWSKDAGRTWPVLYLLHGCCEDKDYESWTAFTDVEEYTADKDVLVVMPTAGRIGMYSKWWNWGLSDKPDWPTFHVTELLQILERGYGAGQDRAVAGLSMGGYGAMEYASRFPGTFGAAASYSGGLNVLMPPMPEVTQLNVIAQGNFIWGLLWGSPWVTRHIWRDHNPYDKVEELRGTHLFVSAGSGGDGPLDDPDAPPIVGELLESVSEITSKSFTDKLQRNGIPVTTDYYGPGDHSWPYWERALKRSWPVLSQGLGI